MSLSACVRYLRDYVAIPSVNPMRREDIPAEIVGERRYAEHLAGQLRGLGLDAELIGTGERASVVAEATAAGSMAAAPAIPRAAWRRRLPRSRS